MSIRVLLVDDQSLVRAGFRSLLDAQPDIVTVWLAANDLNARVSLDHYAADLEHLAEYARMAATAEGFARYLEKFVHAQRAA